MSTGLACAILEAKPGQWYLLLQTDGNEHDWQQSASVDGPFDTQDAADEYLVANYANPGGVYFNSYSEEFSNSSYIQDIISRARHPRKAQFWR